MLLRYSCAYGHGRAQPRARIRAHALVRVHMTLFSTIVGLSSPRTVYHPSRTSCHVFSTFSTVLSFAVLEQNNIMFV